MILKNLTSDIRDALGCDFLTSGMMIYAPNNIEEKLKAPNDSFTTNEKINRETYTVKMTYVHQINLDDLHSTDPGVNKAEAV
jgi:hypothetical protein